MPISSIGSGSDALSQWRDLLEARASQASPSEAPASAMASVELVADIQAFVSEYGSEDAPPPANTSKSPSSATSFESLSSILMSDLPAIASDLDSIDRAQADAGPPARASSSASPPDGPSQQNSASRTPDGSASSASSGPASVFQTTLTLWQLLQAFAASQYVRTATMQAGASIVV